jgi:hypothetical protein
METDMTDIQRAPKSFAPSLAERTEHRTWIKGRAATLLAHYWREDDDPALLAAMGKDWADVLEGLPQEIIQRACIQYQRDEPRRKPTPGAVYEIAMQLMPRPKQVRIDHTTPMRDPADVVTPEKAEAILREAGFRPKRFGGDGRKK